MKRRSGILALLLLLVFAAAVATGCGGSSAGGGDVVKLRVGYIPDIHGGALVAVANEKGIWKKHNLEITAEKFASGPPEIEAIVAGKLDIAYIGPGASWMAASGKAVVIAVDSLNTGDYVIAHPKSGVKELKDLKGKKVGVPKGTSGEMILQLALKKAGLTDKDIEMVGMDPPAVVTAFVGGQIDVAAIWSPLTEEIKKRVPDAKFLVDNTHFFPEYSFPQMWVASPKLVKENPDAVVRWLKAYQEANDYRMAHVEDAVKWTAALAQAPEEGLRSQAGTTKWLSSKEMLEANKDGTTYKWFEGLGGLFVQFGKLEKVVPAKDFVNVDLFAKAMK